MDKLDFLDDASAPNEDVQPVETPAEPVVETPAVTEAVQAEAPQAATLTPPVLDTKPEPGFVPITAVLDERDKRQKLERELEQYRSQQPAPQAPATPDAFDDPEGFTNHQAAIAQSAALNVRLDMSEEFVRQQKGDALVDQARDWALEQFQKRPGFQQEALNQRNPYGYIVQQYERDQIASNVTSDDFAQFQAWRAAQATVAPPAAPAVTPSPVPPTSIVAAPSAGGVQHVPTGPGQAYDALFSKG